ncbi:hypothetical protein [Aureispira anguillae]|uniref:Uncharacterized protein n=1 Tax=Aureispira anguillae TaxID=2864201 RepID=A0A915YL79_9BACT|nr:hypothetical protein [Aureispira anguillae]BDS15064.1 hypothetical protein AsAng_0058460 [Aureispira anguillae]
MTVIQIKHIEDCFDGSSVKELLLSEAISSDLIHALGKTGDLQYFPHFARPFFKIRLHKKLDVKGIEGNDTLRIRLKAPIEVNLKNFIDSLTQLSQ